MLLLLLRRFGLDMKVVLELFGDELLQSTTLEIDVESKDPFWKRKISCGVGGCLVRSA